ncbi:hypothetical protein FA10DRAFT_262250 [Acaromyces ingoldii]|uniref:RxLR effector protein n=1 Tax=Acaromyces ingoldii TaxID=215250 RepID=A0A316YEY5_9BASI|nr:hypothetical protein FA10DRAFT_262250 [Acaromyces ingoldii]PWN87789.1 hypothetical protein FA10DRAFT_262250 [Acaromyces ingoldii]
MRLSRFWFLLLAVAILSICVQAMDGEEGTSVTDSKGKAAATEVEGNAATEQEASLAPIYQKEFNPPEWKNEKFRAQWPERAKRLFEQRKKAKEHYKNWRPVYGDYRAAKKVCEEAEASNNDEFKQYAKNYYERVSKKTSNSDRR